MGSSSSSRLLLRLRRDSPVTHSVWPAWRRSRANASLLASAVAVWSPGALGSGKADAASARPMLEVARVGGSKAVVDGNGLGVPWMREEPTCTKLVG